ncbi:hypothetical protein Cst_c06240 [Thermoclostridium stercorarium subsp. stercorarium DSM 8532]|uniref:HEAT repeat domain-containing protein n=2 Tax=Thermoclostridium stercorarium TaxID=1510 RepID=L7VLR8_THES1|nr:hypothetical protein [Thermoclostridium stercorarium]AGC67642.1 hypothetical protein Cst_c06240 [Thermoclostridium stercorarium subsp. stercorarium DSM 8532]AGI38689.1 hypothetical protein Clst_0592 [Thermoclostridium stercorarium subsp. stercorarium DSM 8532]ANW98059.1 hypothetical protein CSTERTH_02870 [Thermoclostridium stercorarium subsp. thermolacticum DSM 2910]
MLNLNEILTESYCTAIRKHFENSLVSEKGGFSAGGREFELYSRLEQYHNEKKKVMNEWAETAVEQLNGMTPSVLINGMEKFSDVFDLFLYMAEHADDDIPPIVIQKLKSFKNEAISALADLAASHLESDPDMLFIAAVSALGEFELTDAVFPLIDLAYKVNDRNAAMDFIEEALRNAGTCVIEPLLEILEGKEIGTVEEMLLYVLASAGSNCRDDRIYRLLRQAFRTMEDKMPAVICLNVYGDGRAIPMLRGYLERNRQIEKNLFFEILGTIEKLGGRTDDFSRLF